MRKKFEDLFEVDGEWATTKSRVTFLGKSGKATFPPNISVDINAPVLGVLLKEYIGKELEVEKTEDGGFEVKKMY